MPNPRGITEREIKIASVLRPLGSMPLTREQALVASKLLGVHWTHVYRLRRRFLASPVASSVLPAKKGRKPGHRLDPQIESIVQAALHRWLPKQRELAHPLLDLCTEIGRHCKAAGVAQPSRNTVANRWALYREEQEALLAKEPGAQKAPGNFTAKALLDIVQIDHTQADAFVVDPWFRRSIGRPWLTLAIDIASRCVVGFYVGMERPNAGTVALLLSRIALPKAPWLVVLGVDAQWPMQGIPKILHLDNAAEFKSKALRAGCAQYGIDLMYRPVGRPHFGGHIERLNRTLMQRLKGLPGTTGNSVKGRKERKPEEGAALTLNEFERWLAVEIGMRYHHSEHRGLMGATPASAWGTLNEVQPPRQLYPGPEAAWDWLVHFMPLTHRTVQGDGVTISWIRELTNESGSPSGCGRCEVISVNARRVQGVDGAVSNA
ncbi:Mu transposase C-terminal domain-containing protein [Variovorax sp. LT1P1]|uniref:Mu transposase C-terminal domain-containing protein n=1 Tax=Variovorax sp. LT1P1 TaxID=3443730 RepID=UPI003F480497